MKVLVIKRKNIEFRVGEQHFHLHEVGGGEMIWF